MDQKIVAGAGGAGIVFLAVIFIAIISSKGGEERLEDIQFLRRYRKAYNCRETKRL